MDGVAPNEPIRHQRTVDLAKRTGQNGTPGDSRGVPLSLLSDPLSHCKYVTYGRVNSTEGINTTIVGRVARVTW